MHDFTQRWSVISGGCQRFRAGRLIPAEVLPHPSAAVNLIFREYPGVEIMALFTNDVQSLGSYYCLIRRKFKRRRKKRSERKGNPTQLLLSAFMILRCDKVCEPSKWTVWCCFFSGILLSTPKQNTVQNILVRLFVFYVYWLMCRIFLLS